MMETSPELETPPRDARLVAAGSGWRALEFVCTAGPEDRPFEERHEQVTIAAVLEGFFTYRGSHGRAVLHSGSLLLGNAGACYECGHEHGRGDRCVSVHLDPELYGEVAFSFTGNSAFKFPAPVMNARPAVTASLARLDCPDWDPMARDIAILQVVETVVGRMSGTSLKHAASSPKDEGRVLRALAYFEQYATEKLELEALAEAAGVSKYHFLRIFRRQVEVTPYRYVLDLRLRRAAMALTLTSAPVSTIALDQGFGDLSTFCRQFAAAFGISPRGYRDRNSKTRRRT